MDVSAHSRIIVPKVVVVPSRLAVKVLAREAERDLRAGASLDVALSEGFAFGLPADLPLAVGGQRWGAQGGGVQVVVLYVAAAVFGLPQGAGAPGAVGFPAVAALDLSAVVYFRQQPFGTVKVPCGASDAAAVVAFADPLP